MALCASAGYKRNRDTVMSKFKTINYFYTALLPVCLLFNAPVLSAQKIVESGEQVAGFRFDDTASAEPILEYQQNIDMLSAIEDKPSLQVFGNGRVLVHYPVYMKKAGDYEMRLEVAELVALLRDLSGNGVMDFDEKKVKEKVQAHETQLKSKGRFYEISDAMETVVDVKLDEYQKDKTSKKIKNFSRAFKWKNLEQDVVRYKKILEITRVHKSIQKLDMLMSDKRLVNKRSR